MVIIIKTRSEKQYEECGHRQGIEILFNNKEVFGAYDGESEDNSMCRNFNAIFKIGDLFHRVYLAGRNGEDFILKQENFKDEEIY